MTLVQMNKKLEDALYERLQDRIGDIEDSLAASEQIKEDVEAIETNLNNTVSSLASKSDLANAVGSTVNLKAFGDTTLLSTWKAAFAYLNVGTAKTLIVPAGNHIIPRASLTVPLDGLLLINNNGLIVFEDGAEVSFDDIRIPLFTFANCTRGGVIGRPVFKYTGTTPATALITMAQFYAATGMSNTIQFGGTYEQWSVILSNSSGMRFENIEMSSTTFDEDHMIPFGINLKPYSATVRASNNVIRNYRIYGYAHGLLYYGQEYFDFDGIRGDYRGGRAPIAPGHLFYSTGRGLNLRSRYGSVRNWEDGANALNWPASAAVNLGAVAWKGCENCECINGVSLHPAGLINSVDDAEYNNIENLRWYTLDTAAVPSAIYILGSSTNNRYKNIFLNAPNKAVTIANVSTSDASNSFFDDIYIRGKCSLAAGTPTAGIIDLFGNNIRGRRIHIEPSDALFAPHLYALASRISASAPTNTATGWDMEMELVGPNVTPAFSRFADSGSQNVVTFSQTARTNGDRLLFSDALSNSTSKETFVQTGNAPASRGFLTDTGGTGANSVSFTLPGRGFYDLDVVVYNNTRSTCMGGSFRLAYSDLAGAFNNVTALGSAFSVGTGVTGLTVTITSAGVVTVAYTKATTFFAAISVGWKQNAAILA